MDVASRNRDRVFAAASALFEQNGRGTFPTVEAVRKLVRINMNDVSICMREWRRNQATHIANRLLHQPAFSKACETPAAPDFRQETSILARQYESASQVAMAELSEARRAAAMAELQLRRAESEVRILRHELRAATSALADAMAAKVLAESRTDEVLRQVGEQLDPNLQLLHPTDYTSPKRRSSGARSDP